MSYMLGRRGLTTAVLGVAVGAALVLLGASRVWWQETVARPAPLRPEEIGHTGASLAPVLPALGLVALAGAGGLLATRGVARRLVGGLLVVVGVAMVATVLGQLGERIGLVWPLACLVGAVIIGGAGILAARHGHRWPVMGSRYARPAASAPTRPASPASRGGWPDSAGGGSVGAANGARLDPAPDDRGDPLVRARLSGDASGGARTASGAGLTPPIPPTTSGPVATVADGASSPVRHGAAGASTASGDGSGDARPANTGRSGGESAPSTTELWDALDRGEDPTRG